MQQSYGNVKESIGRMYDASPIARDFFHRAMHSSRPQSSGTDSQKQGDFGEALSPAACLMNQLWLPKKASTGHIKVVKGTKPLSSKQTSFMGLFGSKLNKSTDSTDKLDKSDDVTIERIAKSTAQADTHMKTVGKERIVPVQNNGKGDHQGALYSGLRTRSNRGGRGMETIQEWKEQITGKETTRENATEIVEEDVDVINFNSQDESDEDVSSDDQEDFPEQQTRPQTRSERRTRQPIEPENEVRRKDAHKGVINESHNHVNSDAEVPMPKRRLRRRHADNHPDRQNAKEKCDGSYEENACSDIVEISSDNEKHVSSGTNSKEKIVPFKGQEHLVKTRSRLVVPVEPLQRSTRSKTTLPEREQGEDFYKNAIPERMATKESWSRSSTRQNRDSLETCEESDNENTEPSIFKETEKIVSFKGQEHLVKTGSRLVVLVEPLQQSTRTKTKLQQREQGKDFCKNAIPERMATKERWSRYSTRQNRESLETCGESDNENTEPSSTKETEKSHSNKRQEQLTETAKPKAQVEPIRKSTRSKTTLQQKAPAEDVPNNLIHQRTGKENPHMPATRHVTEPCETPTTIKQKTSRITALLENKSNMVGNQKVLQKENVKEDNLKRRVRKKNTKPDLNISIKGSEKDPLAIQDLPQTRSGRRVKPRLAWWAGQRVFVHQNSDIVEIKPPTPSNEKDLLSASMVHFREEEVSLAYGERFSQSFEGQQEQVNYKKRASLSMDSDACKENRKANNRQPEQPLGKLPDMLKNHRFLKSPHKDKPNKVQEYSSNSDRVSSEEDVLGLYDSPGLPKSLRNPKLLAVKNQVSRFIAKNFNVESDPLCQSFGTTPVSHLAKRRAAQNNTLRRCTLQDDDEDGSNEETLQQTQQNSSEYQTLGENRDMEQDDQFRTVTMKGTKPQRKRGRPLKTRGSGIRHRDSGTEKEESNEPERRKRQAGKNTDRKTLKKSVEKQRARHRSCSSDTGNERENDITKKASDNNLLCKAQNSKRPKRDSSQSSSEGEEEWKPGKISKQNKVKDKSNKRKQNTRNRDIDSSDDETEALHQPVPSEKNHRPAPRPVKRRIGKEKVNHKEFVKGKKGRKPQKPEPSSDSESESECERLLKKEPKATKQYSKKCVQNKEIVNGVIPQEPEEDVWSEREIARYKQALRELNPAMDFFWHNVAARVGPKTAQQCQAYHQRFAPPTVEKRKKPQPKADKAKRPALTGGVGTLKRKRELKTMINHLNENHEDDFFDATPVRQAKRMKLPTPDDEDDDDFYQNRPNTETPLNSRFMTPNPRMVWMPTNKTPVTTSLLSPELRNTVDKKNTETYVHRITQKNKRPFSGINNTTLQKPSKNDDITKKTDRLSQNLFSGDLAQQREQEIDSEEEEDYYFSDNN